MNNNIAVIIETSAYDLTLIVKNTKDVDTLIRRFVREEVCCFQMQFLIQQHDAYYANSENVASLDEINTLHTAMKTAALLYIQSIDFNATFDHALAAELIKSDMQFDYCAFKTRAATDVESLYVTKNVNDMLLLKFDDDAFKSIHSFNHF